MGENLLQATYIPEPGDGRLLLWKPARLNNAACRAALQRLGLPSAGLRLDSDDAALLLPVAGEDGYRLEKRQVAGHTLAPARTTALVRLASPVPRPDVAEPSPSLRFWASAAAFALELVARHQISPRWPASAPDGAARSRGFGRHAGIAYRPGWAAVLERPEDRGRFRLLTETMPPVARAALMPDGRTASPAATLRAFLDDVADAIVRIAAQDARLEPPAGAWEPTWLGALVGPPRTVTAGDKTGGSGMARELERWTGPLLAVEGDAARAVFRLRAAGAAAGSWRIEAGLEAAAAEESESETLWVPAADALAADTGLELDGRMIRDAKQRMRYALDTAARLMPPLMRLESEPVAVDDTEAGEFLGRVAPELRIRDVGVELPPEIEALSPAGVGVRLRVEARGADPTVGAGETAGGGSRPRQAAGGRARLGLDALLDYRWELALGDATLDEAEFRRLLSEGRTIIELHDRRILLTPQLRSALERRLTALRAERLDGMRLLRAGLAGVLDAAEARTPVDGGEDVARRLAPADASGTAEPPGFRGTLRPYQRRGVAWMHGLARYGLGGVLADDMGLGKTIQLIALVLADAADDDVAAGHDNAANGRRDGAGDDVAAGHAAAVTLVVCPASVLGNWEHELARFAPGVPVVRHHGVTRAASVEALFAGNGAEAASPESDAHGDPAASEAAGDAPTDAAGDAAGGAPLVVVTSYGTMVRDAEMLAGIRWRRVVLDEAQAVKNADTARFRAVRRLAADQRLALTGTPVENRVEELWALLDFLNPGLLGGRTAFQRQFAQPIERDGDAAAAERLRRLTAPFILRRLKTDPGIAAELPEKHELKVYCTLTGEQAALYQAAVDRGLDGIGSTDGIARRGRVLALLSALKQIADHPALLDAGSDAGPHRSGKLIRLLEMLDEVRDAGEHALVFTQYRRMGAIIVDAVTRRMGEEPPFLHGGVPPANRDELVRAFQAGDAGPVFVLSLRAGGTGLNLTRATHVFHFDRWWNPAVEDQATDRAYRIGQRRDVQVHKFVTLATLEERIDAMLEEKRALADAIVGKGETWITELSDAELRDLVALGRGAAVDEL